MAKIGISGNVLVGITTDGIAEGSTNKYLSTVNLSALLKGSLCQGRLTLESGVAISTTDQIAKTSIFFTPYSGSIIGLYSGTSWDFLSFTEKTVSVPATTAMPFDVFAYNDAGAVALETLDWTNDTTRATALVLQDGIYVKSGAGTRRYLGTGRTTGTSGQCEISFGRTPASGGSHPKCYLWNSNNREIGYFTNVEADEYWTYNSTTPRKYNNSAANRFSFVTGLSSLVDVVFNCYGGNSTPSGHIGYVGTGLNTDTVITNSVVIPGASGVLTYSNRSSKVSPIVAPGGNYLQLLESAWTIGGGETVLFYGKSATVPAQSGATFDYEY